MLSNILWFRDSINCSTLSTLRHWRTYVIYHRACIDEPRNCVAIYPLRHDLSSTGHMQWFRAASDRRICRCVKSYDEMPQYIYVYSIPLSNDETCACTLDLIRFDLSIVQNIICAPVYSRYINIHFISDRNRVHDVH